MRLVDGSDDSRPANNFAPAPPINARQMWANNRFWMETQNLVTKRWGGKRKQHWQALLAMMKTFAWGLKLVGQYERGVRNAAEIVLREIDLHFPDAAGRRSTASPSCTSPIPTWTACRASTSASSIW